MRAGASPALTRSKNARDRRRRRRRALEEGARGGSRSVGTAKVHLRRVWKIEQLEGHIVEIFGNFFHLACYSCCSCGKRLEPSDLALVKDGHPICSPCGSKKMLYLASSHRSNASLFSGKRPPFIAHHTPSWINVSAAPVT